MPAEAGMLAFFTPEPPLQADTTYTLAVNGARDTNDFPLPPVEVKFTTVADASPPGTASGKEVKHPPTPGTRAAAEKEDPKQPPLQGPPGVTALTGEVRTIHGKVLPNVTLTLECDEKEVTTRSDATGRFLLLSPAAGHCELEIDGTTASSPGQSYGRFYPGVDLLPRITNVLPYTIWMTPLDKQFEVTIPSPTTSL